MHFISGSLILFMVVLGNSCNSDQQVAKSKKYGATEPKSEMESKKGLLLQDLALSMENENETYNLIIDLKKSQVTYDGATKGYNQSTGESSVPKIHKCDPLDLESNDLAKMLGVIGGETIDLQYAQKTNEYTGSSKEVLTSEKASLVFNGKYDLKNAVSVSNPSDETLKFTKTGKKYSSLFSEFESIIKIAKENCKSNSSGSGTETGGTEVDPDAILDKYTLQ